MNNEYMMKEVIPAHLREIEREHNVKILLAVESGSRAWGFESSDSDWDVRFIYVHIESWYLKVEKQRDVIEKMTDDNVDLAGWELRKALLLLSKSNPSLLEWIHSPIIYYKYDWFWDRIKNESRSFYDRVKTIYHYNSIYNKHNERYINPERFKVKRFLYYLRGILACKWIEKNKTVPPVNFYELYNAVVDDESIRDSIAALVEKKKTRTECDMLELDKNLVEYAITQADYYNQMISTFRPQKYNYGTHSLDYVLECMIKEDYMHGMEMKSNKLGDAILGIQDYIEKSKLRKAFHLVDLMKQLPAIKIKDGYVLDFLERDYYSDIPYCHTKDASETYNPFPNGNPEPIISPKERLRKIIMELMEDNYTPKPAVEYPPYNDTMLLEGNVPYEVTSKLLPITSYIEAPFTQEGILQAWFIHEYKVFLRLLHYCDNIYIGNTSVVYKLKTHFMERVKYSLFAIDIEKLLPRITIDGDKALFEYAYWNSWQGLVQVKQHVLRKGNSIEFDKKEQNTLVQYDCGFMY